MIYTQTTGATKAAVEADFAWFALNPGRRLHLRLAFPGEVRTVPAGMSPATFAILAEPDLLVRVPMAIEAGAKVEALTERGCQIVLARLVAAEAANEGGVQ